MTAIVQALNAGHSTKKILKYLSQQNPELAAKISGALEAGHTIDHIINFISKNEKKMGNLIPEKKEEKNPFKKIQTSIHPALTGATKALGTAAGAIGGGYALSRAIPSILQRGTVANAANAVSSVPDVSGNSQQPLLSVNQSKMQPSNVLQGNTSQLTQQPPSNLGNANIAQVPETMQPKGISNPKEYLEKKGVLQAVNESLKRGNNPEQVAVELGIKRSGNAKIDPELLAHIEEYAKQPQIEESTNLKPEPTKLVKEPIKIEKNSIVSSPNGIGSIKEIRNGKALIDVDGKLHKVKEEDLEAEPEEVKKSKVEINLEDVTEDLRSAPLNEVYSPAHRKHVTIKYNSDIGKDKSKRYIFYKKDGSPVDENIIENLRIGSQIPITSGKNFWGGWSSDTQDSRGTVAYHELSKLAQKMGEEDDPSKPYWFEEEEEVFTHGYSKQAEKKLKEEEKKFNEANKKPKKKRA